MDEDKEDQMLERIVRLETLMEQVQAAEERSRANQQIIQEALLSIQRQLAKYSGAWGMLLMIISALWAAFALFKDSIFKENK